MPKPKKKKNQRNAEEGQRQARLEEMDGLAAIFSEAFQQDEDDQGFTLHLVPHAGEASGNNVSVDLVAQYPRLYPNAPLGVRLQNATGLSRSSVKSLLAQLQTVAKEHASDGQICAFALAEAGAEYLQSNNRPAQDKQDASLWHDMQERVDAHEAEEPDMLAPSADLVGSQDLFGGAQWRAPPAKQAHVPSPVFQPEPLHKISGPLLHASPPQEDERLKDGHGIIPPSEASTSFVGRALEAVRSSIGVVSRAISVSLPPALQRLLDGQLPGSESEEDTYDEEMDDIKKDLLLGHLLAKVARSEQHHQQQTHVLPTLASSLTELQLLPRWIQWSLTAHPKLFQRAFKRVMSEELQWQGHTRDSASALLLKRFWDSAAIEGPVPSMRPALGTSRYASDFEEVRELGKGAHGTVVAARNRLDDRQYAVKKILMRESSQSYSRIMREVDTLSRLQHPHVVRYFQAWQELTPSTEIAGSSSSDSQPFTSEQTSRTMPGSADASVSTWPFSKTQAGKLAAVAEEGDFGTEDARASNTSPFAEDYLQVLYIQMEFCPRTLRQVLSTGSLPDASAWQVLRQILAGLAYIHSQGIIHRDLNPNNLFYDARGEIRLGDFGLAKFTSQQGLDLPTDLAMKRRADMSQAQAVLPSMTPEQTGVVGTSFYISPEINEGWPQHDEKVDMYSLGIIVFELWHPFSTGMERAELLRDLRYASKLPSDWEAQHSQVSALIRWVMSANPADRPTARELLRSDLLPPTVGDEQLQDVLRSLQDNHEAQQRVLDALFNLSSTQDILQDNGPGSGPCSAEAIQGVADATRNVCSLHGAMPMASPELRLSDGREPSPEGLTVLSSTGACLVLRDDLRRPFASWLAESAALSTTGVAKLDSLRRYEIATVHRRSSGRAPSRPILQADVDFLHPPGQPSADSALTEAEVIKVIAEVLEAVGLAFEVRISHRVLLEAVLGHVKLPKELQSSALALLSTAASQSPAVGAARGTLWQSIRVALSGLGVPSSAVAACKQFVTFVPGEAEAALQRVRPTLEAKSANATGQLAASLDHLQVLVGHLHRWGIPASRVLLDPLLRPHAEYMTSTLFQVHILQDASGTTLAAAAGGRYDKLLQSVWMPAAALQMRAPAGVGATINLERLLPQPMANADAHLAATSAQADVLVCAKGGSGLLGERMDLCRQLWAAGLKAEMVHTTAPSMQEQYGHAETRSIPWLVIIPGATFSVNDTVKVRNLERRSEEDMPYAEVARYLQERLSSQGSQAAGSRSGPSMLRMSSRPDLPSVLDDGEGSDEEDQPDVRDRGRRRRDRR